MADEEATSHVVTPRPNQGPTEEEAKADLAAQVGWEPGQVQETDTLLAEEAGVPMPEPPPTPEVVAPPAEVPAE